MRVAPAVLFVLTVPIALPPRAAADDTTAPWTAALSPGVKARVTSSAFSRRLEGRVQTADAKEIVLGTEDGVPLRFATATVQRLEIVSGRKRRPWRGALIGAWTGLVMGVAVTSMERVDCGGLDGDDGVCSRGEAITSLTLGGALWGLGIGALIKSDEWTDVRLPGVTVAPAPDGVRVALRWRF